MVRKVAIIALVGVLAVGTSGCVLRKAEGTERRSEEREVSGFDSVEFDGWGALTIEQGDEYALTVSGADELLDRLETEVRGDTLRISMAPKTEIWFFGTPDRDIEMKLTVPELSRLEVNGAGAVELDGIEGDSLELELDGAADVNGVDFDLEDLSVVLSGAGHVELDGRADRQSVDISGLGAFDGSELEGRDGEVMMSGAGAATVWVTDTLEVDLTGLGSIEYYGDPDVETGRMDGAGSIDSLGDK
jgi:hypothetical protein